MPALLLALLPGSGFGQFQAVHGLTSADYEAWVKKVVAAGNRLTYVHGYDAGGSPQFVAFAVKGERRFKWESHHDLDSKRAGETFKRLSDQGYRPLCLGGYFDNKQPRFAGVWVQDRKGAAWAGHFNLTLREYREMEARLKKQGLRPEQVTGYADGTASPRFAALFVQGDMAWETRLDLTAEQFRKLADEQKSRGMRPTSISVYPTSAGPRFAAVFIKDATAWAVQHGLTSALYQTAFDRRIKEGYRPLCIAGYLDPDPALYDAAMKKFMKERTIRAGTLAVSRGGWTFLARGYGFADRAGKRRLRAEDPLRLASVVKPITAAAVRKLVRDKKLTLDTKAFPLLGLKPLPGKKPDPRLNDISIRQLLEHRGGWDRDKAFDPMFRPLEIAAAVGKAGPAGPRDIIRYMMGQPLQFTPDEQSCYSNFGYCVLGRVIEKVSGQDYLSYVRKEILAPLKIESVTLGRSLPKDRKPREPVYLDPRTGRNVVQPRSRTAVPLPDGGFYLEALDSHGGLIGSSVDLIRFLDAYWISGEPRRSNGGSFSHFGSLPGTWSMVMQELNGVNVVAVFNQSTDPSKRKYETIKDMMRQAADRLGDSVRFAVVWVK